MTKLALFLLVSSVMKPLAAQRVDKELRRATRRDRARSDVG